jgi:hypothetical protein
MKALEKQAVMNKIGMVSTLAVIVLAWLVKDYAK